jgi:hypothetical protein
MLGVKLKFGAYFNHASLKLIFIFILAIKNDLSEEL